MGFTRAVPVMRLRRASHKIAGTATNQPSPNPKIPKSAISNLFFFIFSEN
jgi:hypothetical protein